MEAKKTSYPNMCKNHRIMKINGLRWVIITLIGIATVINFIDRNALAVMWPGISKELGMDKSQYAFVISCFMIAYGISQSLSGRIYDKIGTRLGFVMSITVWSIAAMIHSLAKGVLSFSIFRGLLGLGEAGNWPGAAKSNAEWFPIKERAFAQGIFNAGASLGAVISAPLIAYFYAKVGWQTTFILIGLLGFIWIIPWWLINKASPSKHPWITEGEQNYILEGQKSVGFTTTQTEEKALTMGEILQYRQSWSIILSRFFLDPIWWLFVSWLPIYLNDRFGFDVKQIGMFAWMPYVGAMIGSLGGGLLSIYLMGKGWFVLGGRWSSIKLKGRGWSVNRTRRFCIALGGCLMFPALIASAFAATPLWAMATMFVALMGFQVAIGNIQTMPSDFFLGKNVGTLAGLGGTSAICGVLITTWLVPSLTKNSYTPFFALATLLVPLGMGMIFWLSGEIKRVR
jgi:MFS transporter, ACS family, hexuronate transporter